MNDYTYREVMQYISENDVKFIRLAFCDIFGKQKNISIMPRELSRAFEEGISFDASAVRGFMNIEMSDLLLFHDPTTLSILPWRPSQGRVVRFFCDIKYPDGTPFEGDGRQVLRQAQEDMRRLGYSVKSARNVNSICCGRMKTVCRPRSRTTTRPIWISRRWTRVRMCAARSA